MTETPPQLLGRWMCVALVVGNMIGSGIFLMPSALAPYGLNSVVAWAFTASGALLLALVFARLGRALPEPGGAIAHVRLAFGPFAEFVVAWGYWISVWVGNAAIATGGVAYLSEFFPALDTSPGLSAGVTIAVVWVLTGVNCVGVRAVGGVQVATTVMKLVPLAAILFFGLLALMRDPAPVQVAIAQTRLDAGAITASAALTLWALLGVESASVATAKAVDPERTVPFATLVGCAVTALVCMAVCTIVLLLLPADVVAKSKAPLADAMRLLLGDGAAHAVAAFAAISAFGCVNGWILLQGEVPQALAQSGSLPPVFGRASRAGIPVFAICVGSALVTLLVLANASKSMVKLWTFMALLSTSTCLVMYLVVSLAALRLHATKRWAATTPVLVAAALAAVYSVWTLYGAGAEAFWYGVGLLAAGVPLYAITRIRREKPRYSMG